MSSVADDVRSTGPIDAGYCALLPSGGVDCWGGGSVGELGNGASNDSAGPVTVEGVEGTGTLSGVTSLANDGFYSYCALLNTSGVDCWGAEFEGVLGDGRFSKSKVPVEVEQSS